MRKKPLKYITLFKCLNRHYKKSIYAFYNQKYRYSKSCGIYISLKNAKSENGLLPDFKNFYGYSFLVQDYNGCKLSISIYDRKDKIILEQDLESLDTLFKLLSNKGIALKQIINDKVIVRDI